LAPIIISSKHIENFQTFDCIIVPAFWGLIPRWHKGNYREHGFNTVNFCAENMDQSRMYKPAFNRGQRCVLICEGFYEHQRVPYRLPPEERSIYYIYSSQRKGIEIDNKSTWNCRVINMLYIAAIFDSWRDDNDNEIFNFTILSMGSGDNVLSWLHPRTPAILETAEKIHNWLNNSKIFGNDALKVIQSPKQIDWHQVSNHVLDVDNKDDRCNKAIKFKYQSDDNED